jgi:hypothetical protein
MPPGAGTTPSPCHAGVYLGSHEKARRSHPPRWGVYALKKKAERLGSIEARDPAHANEAAVKQYEVAERERFRISVQREA